MAGALLHVVLVTFHDEASPDQRERLKRDMAGLGAACGGATSGILHWQADWNLDRRKGYDLMSAGVFASAECFAAYRADRAHRDFTARMSAVADWIVGDLPWTMAPPPQDEA